MSRRTKGTKRTGAKVATATLLLLTSAHAETLSVGPGKSYAAPCAAIAAAHDDDVIEIDAGGDYGGDVCQISPNGLTLKGVDGRAKIDAQGKSFGGKAIWVITGHDTVIENIEFLGATVASQNGAGIRQEGDNLTVRRCYFHDNEDGILTDASPQSQILVEYSEFGNNGFGDGYSHNLYIGNVARFTMQFSYSHDAKVGHLLKSRAKENYILYNRLSGERGSSSYELDLPNAGTAVVLGNFIEQGPNTQNPTLLAYGEEGLVEGNPGHDLHVVNNTFVNDRDGGGTFVNIGDTVDVAAQLQNNIFAGSGTLSNQPSALLTHDFSDGDPLFVARSSYDYTLEAGSPCIDRGSDAGALGTQSLQAQYQYVHPTQAAPRSIVGSAIDIGAAEFSDGSEPLAGGAGSAASAGSSNASAGSSNASAGSSPNDSAGAPSAGSVDPREPATENSSCSCHAGRASEARWPLVVLLAPLAGRFRARSARRKRRD